MSLWHNYLNFCSIVKDKHLKYKYKIANFDYSNNCVFIKNIDNKSMKIHIEQLFYSKDIISNMPTDHACLIGVEYKKYISNTKCGYNII